MTPDPHVPDMRHTAQITGERGAKVWATATGAATVDIWAQDADRCNMALVQLDKAGLLALVAALTDAAAALEG